MITQESALYRSSGSSMPEREQLDSNEASSSEVSVRSRTDVPGMVIRNAQCRYHVTAPCDCDRYFAPPGAAEYGC